MIELPFLDRRDAGRQLGAELTRNQLKAEAVVLALPRGGLPVAVEVAKALRAPLDIVLVRKLGVPWQPELAMGAIAGETRVLDQQLVAQLGISDEEIEHVVDLETAEMDRRTKLYRSGPGIDVRGRTVVLVDDGLATGSTMVAAARHIRSLESQQLIIAVPVASFQACSRLKREVDECICLATPAPFNAVGEWYIDFRQVTDSEVQALLQLKEVQSETEADS